MIKKKKRVVKGTIFKRIKIITVGPRCLCCPVYKHECPSIYVGTICDIANNYELYSRLQYVII